MLVVMNAWYGWSFIAAAVILALNFLIMLKMSYPSMNPVKKDTGTEEGAVQEAPKSNGILKASALFFTATFPRPRSI